MIIHFIIPLIQKALYVRTVSESSKQSSKVLELGL